jgi:hypothetical protein
MNHLKIYESYKGDKLKKAYQDSILYKYLSDYELNKARLETQKEEILSLLTEYVELNKEYLTNKYNYYWWNDKNIASYKFVIEKGRIKFSLSFRDDNADAVFLNYDDIENLLKFLEDPDLYRNERKYNI